MTRRKDVTTKRSRPKRSLKQVAEKLLGKRKLPVTDVERGEAVKKVEALIEGGATKKAALFEVGLGYRTFHAWQLRLGGQDTGLIARVVRKAVQGFMRQPDVTLGNLENKLTGFILRLHV